MMMQQLYHVHGGWNYVIYNMKRLLLYIALIFLLGCTPKVYVIVIKEQPDDIYKLIESIPTMQDVYPILDPDKFKGVNDTIIYL